MNVELKNASTNAVLESGAAAYDAPSGQWVYAAMTDASPAPSRPSLPVAHVVLALATVLATLTSVAILFIIFDLEVAFLFPWAITLGAMGAFAFWSMMVFLGVLTVGFIYEWKKGALEWD